MKTKVTHLPSSFMLLLLQEYQPHPLSLLPSLLWKTAHPDPPHSRPDL